MDDEDLAYVMTRYREVHDFWHVLSGLHTDVLQEIALKMLELLQTGLPVAALSSVFGPLKLSLPQHRLLWTVYVPWVIQTHRRAPFLMNIYYEHHLERPLLEVRQEWGFHHPLH